MSAQGQQQQQQGDYASLRMRPGIDVQMTPLLNEAGFSFSTCVRFFQGLLQKLGGWAHINLSGVLVGVCRGMHSWADLTGNPYIACGTNVALEIFSGGNLIDITPIRVIDNVAVDFSTVMGSNIVTVKDVAHGALTGDRVNIVVSVSVGGLILQGYYFVTVVDADNYTIVAAANAAATVNNGGVVPSFTTVMGSPDVNVAFPNHGLVVDNPFFVQVEVDIAGFTISGGYTVTAVTDADNFTIQPGGNATASTGPVFENGGNAQLQYPIPTGPVSATLGMGSTSYGAGIYGAGIYGGGSAVIIPLRQWFLDNFGEDLIGNYTRSPFYVWVPGTPNAVAVDTTNYPGAKDPPSEVNSSFVSTPQRMVIALGASEVGAGPFDPLLVRWSDAGDFTDWKASSTNLAGSYRIPTGSALRGGITAPNFSVIWTDIDMWLMTFLGATGLSELVWGFTKVAAGVDLLCARGCGVHRNVVYWISSNGFYAFDGNQIRPLACPVWDKLFQNLNRLQVEKANCQVNSWFQEISWAFPSIEGGEVDTRVTLNVSDPGKPSWTYDDTGTVTARTAWIDEGVYGAPAGTDIAGNIQQHEVSNDNDGNPLLASARTGWFSVVEGSLVMHIERLAADLIATGGDQTVKLTVLTQSYPTGPVSTYGPYNWNPASGPPWSIVRARGRFFSIIIGSATLGTFWRLGNLRYVLRPAGKRP